MTTPCASAASFTDPASKPGNTCACSEVSAVVSTGSTRSSPTSVLSSGCAHRGAGGGWGEQRCP
eukprot:9174774-Karenia_brevis.AAC.1